MPQPGSDRTGPAVVVVEFVTRRGVEADRDGSAPVGRLARDGTMVGGEAVQRVVRAERHDAPVGQRLLDAASGDTLDVEHVAVHELLDGHREHLTGQTADSVELRHQRLAGTQKGVALAVAAVRRGFGVQPFEHGAHLDDVLAERL